MSYSTEWTAYGNVANWKWQSAMQRSHDGDGVMCKLWRWVLVDCVVIGVWNVACFFFKEILVQDHFYRKYSLNHKLFELDTHLPSTPDDERWCHCYGLPTVSRSWAWDSVLDVGPRSLQHKPFFECLSGHLPLCGHGSECISMIAPSMPHSSRLRLS